MPGNHSQTSDEDKRLDTQPGNVRGRSSTIAAPPHKRPRLGALESPLEPKPGDDRPGQQQLSDHTELHQGASDLIVAQPQHQNRLPRRAAAQAASARIRSNAAVEARGRAPWEAEAVPGSSGATSYKGGGGGGGGGGSGAFNLDASGASHASEAEGNSDDSEGSEQVGR
jgi:hypothetical protein